MNQVFYLEEDPRGIAAYALIDLLNSDLLSATEIKHAIKALRKLGVLVA